jgi:hypothetical protein
MATSDMVKALKEAPHDMTNDFKGQLETVGKRAADQGRETTSDVKKSAASKGIDRSREFAPVSRPTLVRSLAR